MSETNTAVYRPIKNNGSKHGASKWTEAAVIALRKEYDEIVKANGRTWGAYAELHRRHPEMSRQSIEFIIQRKTWRHC